MKTKAKSYHPAAFDSIADSSKGVSIQGFFNCSEATWPILKRFEAKKFQILPIKSSRGCVEICEVSRIKHQFILGKQKLEKVLSEPSLTDALHLTFSCSYKVGLESCL